MWERLLLPIFLSLPVSGERGERDEDGAAPSNLTTAVPEDVGQPLDVIVWVLTWSLSPGAASVVQWF